MIKNGCVFSLFSDIHSFNYFIVSNVHIKTNIFSSFIEQFYIFFYIK